MALLLSAGALMICGLAIMFAEQLWLFYLGCAVLSFGAALATPAYQLLLNDKLTDGTGAGWIATSHTLGYGLCDADGAAFECRSADDLWPGDNVR
ncbi:hypothetical protein A9X63_26945 [Klebsiella pneumoniae]|nr:hypothetical protein A9X63_26945 [Klebsiella pneumoniae]